jgi:hypothetical protein
LKTTKEIEKRRKMPENGIAAPQEDRFSDSKEMIIEREMKELFTIQQNNILLVKVRPAQNRDFAVKMTFYFGWTHFLFFWE